MNHHISNPMKFDFIFFNESSRIVNNLYFHPNQYTDNQDIGLKNDQFDVKRRKLEMNYLRRSIIRKCDLQLIIL